MNEVSSSQGMQAATMASMQVVAGQGQRSTTACRSPPWPRASASTAAGGGKTGLEEEHNVWPIVLVSSLDILIFLFPDISR